MATYKGIQGYSVQTLASDPSPTASVEGQLWFNSTSSTYKIAVAGAGAWASGTSLNVARTQITGIGISTAAMALGGNVPPQVDSSETYDGSTWTEGNNLNTARRNASATGTTTAGMIVGGSSPAGDENETEFYDGTSWSAQTGTLTRAGGMQAMGTAGASQTSAIVFGGEPGTTWRVFSETWDGTSWSEGNNLNTTRSESGGTGIVTAALCIGGYFLINNVESYDGTCWTETSTDINQLRASMGSSGTSTACVIFGGKYGSPETPTALTESFNGTTWTEVGDLATARQELGDAQSPAGTNASALALGGDTGPPTYLDIVEAWSDPAYTVKTVTTS